MKIITIIIFFIPFTLFSNTLDGENTNNEKVIKQEVFNKKINKTKTKINEELNKKKEDLATLDFREEKKEKEKDFFSFLAPENFIGIIYFLILLGGGLIIKRIFFDEEKIEK